jgi:type III restriction enzyme
MKLKFKQQGYQTEAVKAIVDCFAVQPKNHGSKYAIDPGRAAAGSTVALPGMESDGFANANIALPPIQLLNNLQGVQRRQNLSVSPELKKTSVCDVNLDIEMETGTGKTYCYIKTMFELNREYGWGKFIVVVPSIAIREGVLKSFEDMAEHFLGQYGKCARYFVYNSKQLHNLESFSSDAGINVMIINAQAFNARGEDARRIYLELDDFQSRRPIDVINKNRPILILDEPQKMEGKATTEKLAEFNPLMILRYSATHKTEHNKVYRLDAIDAYNQKLVKKIAVRGITVKGLAGTNAYLYLESIRLATTKPPEARAELEILQSNGIKRVHRLLKRADDLFTLSDGLEQYRGFVVSDINAIENTISFTNGAVLGAGEATGDVNESALRRIQIREAIKAHFDKEKMLFAQGIKVLSLFFIDEVAKYRSYDESGERAGEYAQMFEEEYNAQLNELPLLEDTPYNRYLKGIQTNKTHNGYFSIDKKTKRLVNPDVKTRGESPRPASDLLIGKRTRPQSIVVDEKWAVRLRQVVEKIDECFARHEGIMM